MSVKNLGRLLNLSLAMLLASVVVCLVATIRGDQSMLDVAMWPAYALGMLTIVVDSAYNRAWAYHWGAKVVGDELRKIRENA